MRPPALLFSLIFFYLSLNAQIDEKIQTSDLNIEVEFLEKVNSKFRDVNISITPNGRYLYFMSGRGGQDWTNSYPRYFKGRAEYDGDIWYSQIKEGEWSAPICMPGTVNTSSGEDEPNISPDAQQVYFQSWKTGWERSGGPYYQANLYGDKWDNPVGMGGGINEYFAKEMRKYNRYATDGMSVSPDGNIFLVAAGPDYEGNLDIYISRKDDKGRWSYLKKLDLNTPKDERSVFIAGDNKTVYFGSSGYDGAGGLDIFKTTLNDDDSTGEIINIGAPFNTKKDDYGFIIGALGDDCFFVREDDIYYAHLKGADEKIKPSPTLVINGTVKDTLGQPLQANISLFYGSDSKLVATARSNSKTGEYSMSVPKTPGKYRQEYKIGEYTQEMEFDLEEDSENLLSLETEIKPAEPEPEPVVTPQPESLAFTEKGVETISELIFFDFDQHDIKEVEVEKLNQFVEKLQTRKTYQLSVIGHTDAIGSDGYNLLLSERRANQVANFLRAKGLEVEVKIDFKGEQIPALENTSSANRAKNRRVEIKIE